MISIRNFFGMERKNSPKYLKREYIFMHPVLGILARRSGYIYSLRFFGNFVSGDDHSKDKANGGDYIWSILRILFPSTGGNLTTVSNARGNFGSHTTPKMVADIIHFSVYIRLYQEEVAEIIRQRVYTISGGGEDLGFKEAILEVRNSMRDITNQIIGLSPEFEEYKLIIMHIFNAITNQNKNEITLGYPKYTIELLLLAFLDMHYNNNRILEEYYNDILDDFCGEDRPPEADLDFFDDKISHLTPYGNSISSLIGNGNCEVYDRSCGRVLETIFADCVETSIRHLLTILFYDSRTGDTITTKNNEINKFFASLNDPNDGSMVTRSRWNSIVGDLNRVPNALKIDYDFKIDDAQYDLGSSMLNYCKLLSRLFELTNYDETFGILSTEVNVDLLIITFSQILEEISGRDILCKLSGNNPETYYFDLIILIDNKIEITLHNSPGHAEIYKVMELGLKSYEPEPIRRLFLEGLPDVFGLINYVSTRCHVKPHDNYLMFGKKLNDNINYLEFFSSLMSVKDKKKILGSLVHVLQSFSWMDAHMCSLAMDPIARLMEIPFFEELIVKFCRGMVVDEKSYTNAVGVNLKFLKIDFSDQESESLDFCFQYPELEKLVIQSAKLERLIIDSSWANMREIFIYRTWIKSCFLDLTDLIDMRILYLVKLETSTLEDPFIKVGKNNTKLHTIHISEFVNIDIGDLPNLQEIYITNSINMVDSLFSCSASKTLRKVGLYTMKIGNINFDNSDDGWPLLEELTLDKINIGKLEFCDRDIMPRIIFISTTIDYLYIENIKTYNEFRCLVTTCKTMHINNSCVSVMDISPYINPTELILENITLTKDEEGDFIEDLRISLDVLNIDGFVGDLNIRRDIRKVTIKNFSGKLTIFSRVEEFILYPHEEVLDVRSTIRKFVKK